MSRARAPRDAALHMQAVVVAGRRGQLSNCDDDRGARREYRFRCCDSRAHTLNRRFAQSSRANSSHSCANKKLRLSVCDAVSVQFEKMLLNAGNVTRADRRTRRHASTMSTELAVSTTLSDTFVSSSYNGSYNHNNESGANGIGQFYCMSVE